MNTPIRKAVFPVAGLGTRFLPATKANPKEMLPIVDKPLIQYAVEEAINAGITQLIFVTSGAKRSIEDHFDCNHELEVRLAERGKNELLSLLRSIRPEGVQCIYVRQSEPKGLGDAVLCASEIVGDEPFAVILADDLMDSVGKNCLTQMLSVYHEYGSSVIAVEKIEPSLSERYGIVGVHPEQSQQQVGRIHAMVEKPTAAKAPSNLAIAGRYLLHPRIFDVLKTIGAGEGGEIQLTDALVQLLSEQPIYSLAFQGKRYDCGSKLGYMQASIDFALKHPEIGQEIKVYLDNLSDTNAVDTDERHHDEIVAGASVSSG